MDPTLLLHEQTFINPVTSLCSKIHRKESLKNMCGELFGGEIKELLKSQQIGHETFQKKIHFLACYSLDNQCEFKIQKMRLNDFIFYLTEPPHERWLPSEGRARTGARPPECGWCPPNVPPTPPQPGGPTTPQLHHHEAPHPTSRPTRPTLLPTTPPTIIALSSTPLPKHI